MEIKSSKMSKAHCIISASDITDSSSFGTFIHTRTKTQEEFGLQSDVVPFSSETQFLGLYGFVLSIK